MDERLRQALIELDRAVAIPGRNPHYHRAQIARLRRDWPTLWAAIENVREAAAAADQDTALP
ncbi:hypothetical protein [Mycolicibacterium conceptionense]|uniref:hypothetical protein n=1 Tax=Mycolicibacterium conceptionense TaxID=451644 RepID=UPI0009BBF160|nr:hypothetical protein [Mycolicibacterium conceptionense]